MAHTFFFTSRMGSDPELHHTTTLRVVLAHAVTVQ